MGRRPALSGRVWRIGVLLLAVVLGSTLLRAQEPVPPAAAPEFGASLDVRVVNVEAVVTDRKGNRVEGLTAADFRLLVDGREVPVEYFTEVRGGKAVVPPDAATSPEAGAAAPVSPAPSGGPGVGVSYLVFVDESSTIAADRDLMLKRLEDDLRLGPDDRMAIVAFNGGALDLLSDWTGDAEALRGVLRSARERPADGIMSLVRRRQQGSDFGWALGELNQSCFDAQASAKAATAAMRAVPPAEGRKVLFLLSGGWASLTPRVLSYGSRFPFDGILGMATAHVLSDRPADPFEVVTGTANLLGYTIYPLNAPSHDPSWSDVEAEGPVPHGLISTEHEMEVRDASTFLTRETGGKTVFNSLRRSAFQRVAEDVRSYYGLGFSPEWRADGRHHDIRVEVRRPGLRVRSRRGFADLTREAQAALAGENLLLFGGRDAKIEVQAGTPKRAGFGRVELPVTLIIPTDALTPSAVAGGYELRGRLAISGVDRLGDNGQVTDIPLRVTLPALPHPGGFTRYQTTVQTSRIQQTLTFAVRDETGGGRAQGQLDYRP
jgi:VWFA-related protein